MNLGKIIVNILGGLIIVTASVFGSLAFSSPVLANNNARCEKRFITMPPWYRGLTNEQCEIDLNKAPSDSELGGSIGPAIIIIVMNVVEILMHIASYAAVAFLLLGGFQFIAGSSSPDAVAKARKTITNSIIGLVISMTAIGIINIVFMSAQNQRAERNYQIKVAKIESVQAVKISKNLSINPVQEK